MNIISQLILLIYITYLLQASKADDGKDFVEQKRAKSSAAEDNNSNTVTPSPLSKRKHSRYNTSYTDTEEEQSTNKYNCKKHCNNSGSSTGKCSKFQIIKTITIFIVVIQACMEHMSWVIYCDERIHKYIMTIYITSLCAIFMHSTKY